jgi:hypothetical protein
MKKILLLIAVIAFVGLHNRLQAQACAVTSVSVELNSTTVSGGSCVVNINLTFNLAHNSGNKFIWMHLWKSADYPNLSYSSPPTAAELSASLANIGIDNFSGTPTLQTSYPPAPSVPVEDAGDGLTLAVTPNGATDIYKISNIQLTVAGGCTTAIAIKGDVWSTQSQSQNNVQCFNKGIIFIANDPTITGFKRCTTPRTLSLGIQTVSVANIHVTYSLYKDDGDGIFEPGSGDVLVGGPTGPFTINSTTPYSNTSVTYTGNNAAGEHSDIWVAVDSDEPGASTVVSLFENGACAPLPVKLTYFNAKRSNASNVGLTWQTAQELNASGFEIQRLIGSGSWQVVGFVPTQALNGNSSSILNYSFNDPNNARGITQYRLRAVDIDANSKFSEIRAVRGEGQAGKIIVYPNPSFDGKVKVVFEDVNGTRDVSLTDMSGRLIKQWTGITNNNLQIDNMTPGYYSLRVVIRETGEQSIEKIVVNKR